jgi:prepilin-type N-terminal cleavage/methylation domain-containing protein
MNKKAFTLVEILIAASILAVVFGAATKFWLAGNRMMEKDVKGFTMNDLGEKLMTKITNDVEQSSLILKPNIDGKTAPVLLLVKYIPDFTKNPEDTDGNPFAMIYYEKQKISYFCVADTNPLHSFLILKREVSDSSGTTTETEEMGKDFLKEYGDLSSNGKDRRSWGIVECYFSRKEFIEHSKPSDVNSPPPIPNKNGCGASSVFIHLKLKSFSKERKNAGYVVDYNTTCQVRGSAI